jgi:hypothetical protein
MPTSTLRATIGQSDRGETFFLSGDGAPSAGARRLERKGASGLSAAAPLGLGGGPSQLSVCGGHRINRLRSGAKPGCGSDVKTLQGPAVGRCAMGVKKLRPWWLASRHRVFGKVGALQYDLLPTIGHRDAR